MKLVKEDIQFIDDYLKRNGIEYWDIRLEMTDHLACKIEDYKGRNDFNTLFDAAIEDLGWHKDLKWYQNNRLKSINAKIRKRYFKNFFRLFTDLRRLPFVLLFVLVYYLLYNVLSNKAFGIVSLILLGLPLVYITLHYIYINFKLKRSGYILYGYFYVIFSLLLSNLFYQLPKPGGFIDVSLTTHQNIVFFTTLFNVLLMFCGILIYKETTKQYMGLRRQLICE